MKRIMMFGIAAAVIFALVAGGWWLVGTRAVGFSAGALTTAAAELRASGTLESDEVLIAAEVPGRIVVLSADEGAQVETGAVLVELDTALLDGKLAQGQAALEGAEANLAQVKAAARPEAIRGAEAVLAQARAARDGAKQAWIDAQAARDTPQELDVRIEAARTTLTIAEANLKQAEALTDAARVGQSEAQRVFDAVDGPTEVQVQTPAGARIIIVNPPARAINKLGGMVTQTAAQTELALAGVDAALAARAAAKANLDALLTVRANPLEVAAQINRAFTQLQVAEAGVKTAQAKLDALKAGATAEQIAAAESEVEQAQAELAVLQVQKSKMTLLAPRAGYVVERFANRGELAVPNAPLLKLADLHRMTLTVYLAAHDLSRVRLGDTAKVQVDGFTDRVFEGQVVFISPDAEFTPRNVQMQAERANLVYAVKLALANSDHVLKPGMGGEAVW